MDVRAHADRLEAILPLILRTIYPPREDDPFAELPLMQLRVVRTLANGKRPMTEVADELRMSASRFTHLVSRLEAVGLVRKHCHPGDRRIKLVELTEEGAGHMQTHMKIRSSRAQEILSSLSEEDRLVLMQSLENLYGQAKAVTMVSDVEIEARSLA
jgi:DNA-binding MarR family transcriptional regulator